MADPKRPGRASDDRNPPDTPQAAQGGERAKSGTTERDHGGAGSHAPGDERTVMEGGATATDGSGPGDERRGRVSPEVRNDGDGTLPDTGMDRDSGAGAAGGRDRGGAEAADNAARGMRRR